MTAVPELLADRLRQIGQARLRVHGNSMFPAIRSGDILTVSRCTPLQIQISDVVLTQREGRVFAHRVVATGSGDGAVVLVTRGDAHWGADPPTPASSLLGRVVGVTGDRGVAREPCRCTRIGRGRGLVRAERLRLQRSLRSWLRRRLNRQ